ncbi:hypothetical protein KAFR_0A08620 [Kazachstania africana CBS 2517]|uniref:Peroxisomal ATPase PEX6 n=1 Tax=Kazachstania africana (strain ATCC 22294 / BCRC 22015 / CBS 2517 / CECT 1963 / NBRC 1671 / NRRL Y-8276) TaxID=1071382 RepID=H2APJ6_KAZAF|nr:hypothetical protein KAFR_0A08620 [Kazachstania africana CBS 2517]CCF56296.1 hypothetical protein KAFR_0A08620 [Kazachstania africana CBS 2517]
MKVSLQFNYDEASEHCELSTDLLEAKSEGKQQSTNSIFATIGIPNYAHLKKQILVNCEVNKELPERTIKLASRLLNVSTAAPTIDYCYIQVSEEKPPTLDSITLLLNTKLYDKLVTLSTDYERLEFFSLKYNIRNLKTVIHNGDLISEGWCGILDCQPFNEGQIDFSKTETIFVRDDEGFLRKNKSIPVNSLDSSRNKYPIKCLKYPVPSDLIIPKPDTREDDTFFIFADTAILLNVDITSGSLILLEDESGHTTPAKLFVLLTPNSYDKSTLYAHPRLLSKFSSSSYLSIKRYNALSNENSIRSESLNVASSVSIARIGGWYQSQKIYQEIIMHNLRTFFMNKERIVKVGDLLPIAFDSSASHLFNEGMGDCPITQYNDALVWFRIENIALSANEENATLNEVSDADQAVEVPLNGMFLINPGMGTKLITSNMVKEKIIPTKAHDILSYYDIRRPFSYDFEIFPYADSLVNIVDSAIKNITADFPINTSILLYSSTPYTGKRMLVDFLSSWLGLSLIQIDCFDLSASVGSLDSVIKIIGYLKSKLENILPYVNGSIVYISHLDTILSQHDPNQDPDSSKLSRIFEIEFNKLIGGFAEKYESVIFIASVSDIDDIPVSIRSQFKFEIEVPIPNEAQRREIFKWHLGINVLNINSSKSDFVFSTGKDVSLDTLAIHSAGLNASDINSIIQSTKADVLSQHIAEKQSSQAWFKKKLIISMPDLSRAIAKARDEFSLSIGAPKIPNVTWADIGGVEQIKGEIMDTIDIPLKHPELFASGVQKRSGILFYGPPGTGKTLMAKAIATNFSLNFFSVKGPELLNMYIGESEANVRKVFQRARDARPCIIFFDEIDSVAPKRGNQGDSGGVMDRIVSQLLAELDSMSSEEGEGVFVIGATNRPDLLDEALLRPGRFDKLLYLGISDTVEKQLNILKALTRKFNMDSDVNLAKLAKICPFNYTGADFYALCSDAMLNAMTRIAKEIDEKLKQYNEHRMDIGEGKVSLKYWFDRVSSEEDTRVAVKMEDFLKAQRELTPSVSQDELDHYLAVKENFES